jgi:proteasome lid subunit RPN8/RPN11
MRIGRQLFDEMVAHAQAEAPNECCGLISSRDGEAIKLYRITNAEASPLKYVMDSQEQYNATNEIDHLGLEIGVIYHSHTRSEPKPSQTDINLALMGDSKQVRFPDSLYVIVGLASEEPDVRAFRIDDTGVTEAELLVE